MLNLKCFQRMRKVAIIKRQERKDPEVNGLGAEWVLEMQQGTHGTAV